jgi:hypothetical protein
MGQVDEEVHPSRPVARADRDPSWRAGPVFRGFPGLRFAPAGARRTWLCRDDDVEQRKAPGPVEPPSVGVGGIADVVWGPEPETVPGLVRHWVDESVLTQDAPSLYVVEYVSRGATVRGVVAELDLEASREGSVIPHEGVIPHRVDEFAARFRQNRTDIEPVLLVQRMSAAAKAWLAATTDSAPHTELSGPQGDRFRLWARPLSTLTDDWFRELGAEPVIVADGHHRLAAHQGLGGVLALVVDAREWSLRLGPIHRIIPDIALDDLMAEIADLVVHVRSVSGGPVPPRSMDQELAACAPGQIMVGDGQCWNVVAFRDRCGLDVEAVHRTFARSMARINGTFLYRHAVDRAIQVARESRGVALLLRPPSLQDVFETVAAGATLPQKATSFWPKPSAAVVMRTF